MLIHQLVLTSTIICSQGQIQEFCGGWGRRRGPPGWLSYLEVLLVGSGSELLKSLSRIQGGPLLSHAHTPFPGTIHACSVLSYSFTGSDLFIYLFTDLFCRYTMLNISMFYSTTADYFNACSFTCAVSLLPRAGMPTPRSCRWPPPSSAPQSSGTPLTPTYSGTGKSYH